MKTPDLKPCPFCGYTKAKITKKRSGVYERTGDCMQVICHKCKARGPIFKAEYDAKIGSGGYARYFVRNAETNANVEALAIEAWNRRKNDENK